jgi:predicted MFS family arabinose efflux permease
MCFVSEGMVVGSVGPSVKHLKSQIGADADSEIGWLLLVQGFGQFLCTLLSGKVYDHLESNHFITGHFLLASQMFSLAVVSACFTSIPWVPVLVVSYIHHKTEIVLGTYFKRRLYYFFVGVL